MRQPPEVIRHWITTIEEESRNLTSWEESFIASVTEQSQWSEKQQEIIERIYTEKTP